MPVPGFPRTAVQGHKPGPIPFFYGGLGDELLGKVVVKIACLHVLSLPDRNIRKVKVQNFQEAVAQLCHGFGPILAHAHIMAVSCAGNDKISAGIACVHRLADFAGDGYSTGGDYGTGDSYY